MPTPTRLAREFNAASPSSIAVRRVDPAASHLVLKVALAAASRIKGAPDNSPVALAPSIPRVPALPVPVREAPAVQGGPAAVLALVHAPAALADHALAASAPLRVAHRLQAKLPALRVLQDRRVAVAVSNIPRPKKAR